MECARCMNRTQIERKNNFPINGKCFPFTFKRFFPSRRANERKKLLALLLYRIGLNRERGFLSNDIILIIQGVPINKKLGK